MLLSIILSFCVVCFPYNSYLQQTRMMNHYRLKKYRHLTVEKSQFSWKGRGKTKGKRCSSKKYQYISLFLKSIERELIKLFFLTSGSNFFHVWDDLFRVRFFAWIFLIHFYFILIISCSSTCKKEVPSIRFNKNALKTRWPISTCFVRSFIDESCIKFY